MRNDQIFVLLLVVLLPMSGCMESAVGEVEGTEGTETTTVVDNTTVVNNYYNQTTNQPPQIYVADVGYNREIDFRDTMESGRISTYDSSTGEELSRMYYTKFQFWFSIIDIDSNITSVGLDLDLDQIIDHQFMTNDSWSNFTYHESPGIAQSNGSLIYSDVGYPSGHFFPYCYARFNLMAFDDDGGIQVLPYTLRMDGAAPNGAGCQEDYTGVEE